MVLTMLHLWRWQDVGISADTAVDIAKETADVILPDKDLMVLKLVSLKVVGLRQYDQVTSRWQLVQTLGISSHPCCEYLLPFLPRSSVHLIVLNLVYDWSCVALPFDNVIKTFKQPHTWEAKSITRFMASMGPISSVFDILTFLSFLYFIIVPLVTGHHMFMGSESAPSVYYLVPKRLVHFRIYVVSNHGHPYASHGTAKVPLQAKADQLGLWFWQLWLQPCN